MEQEKEMAEMAQGVVDDKMREKMRNLIGVRLRTAEYTFNDTVTRLAVKRFAEGIGDGNPLWYDEEHDKKTRYGRLPAPPLWILTIFPCISQFGWTGTAQFHSGSEFTFYRPMLLGDKITPEEVFSGWEEKKSRFAGNMIKDYVDTYYWNQDSDLVAKFHGYRIVVERLKSTSKAKDDKRRQLQLPHPWTGEELEKVEEEVLDEEVRGANPRYWEDVEVGDELKQVVKGPIGLSDMVAYFCGGASAVRPKGHAIQLRDYRKHPAWGFRDPGTYAMEPIYAVHYNHAAARAMGVPFSYDVGIQRHTWLTHLLTNWMSDDGWLKRSYAEYRGFVYLSDVIWLKGKVIKKYFDENGEACVDVESHGINQRGEDVMPGDSTIILPSREKGTWPIDQRLKTHIHEGWTAKNVIGFKPEELPQFKDWKN